MDQILLIIIKSQPPHLLNITPLSYLELISSIYKFKIKKLIPELQGALIIININYISSIKSNIYITVLEGDDIINNTDVLKFFNYNSYKLLMKYKNY